jgi:hypothetical protein
MMDKAEEEQARKLAKALDEASRNSRRLLTYVDGQVVLRSPAPPYTDVPLPCFKEADLNNAVRLGLLQKGSIAGSDNWDWWVLKEPRDGRVADGWFGLVKGFLERSQNR